jgi:hypothetical protein
MALYSLGRFPNARARSENLKGQLRSVTRDLGATARAGSTMGTAPPAGVPCAQEAWRPPAP